jgi:hypothetical protein
VVVEAVVACVCVAGGEARERGLVYYPLAFVFVTSLCFAPRFRDSFSIRGEKRGAHTYFLFINTGARSASLGNWIFASHRESRCRHWSAENSRLSDGQLGVAVLLFPIPLMRNDCIVFASALRYRAAKGGGGGGTVARILWICLLMKGNNGEN